MTYQIKIGFMVDGVEYKPGQKVSEEVAKLFPDFVKKSPVTVKVVAESEDSISIEVPEEAIEEVVKDEPKTTKKATKKTTKKVAKK